MSAHPDEIDFVGFAGGVQPLPEIGVFDRFFIRRFPTAGDPAGQPFGYALLDILAVGIKLDPRGARQSFQPADCRHHLHTVIGRQRLAAGQFFFSVTQTQ